MGAGPPLLFLKLVFVDSKTTAAAPRFAVFKAWAPEAMNSWIFSCPQLPVLIILKSHAGVQALRRNARHSDEREESWRGTASADLFASTTNQRISCDGGQL